MVQATWVDHRVVFLGRSRWWNWPPSREEVEFPAPSHETSLLSLILRRSPKPICIARVMEEEEEEDEEERTWRRRGHMSVYRLEKGKGVCSMQLASVGCLVIIIRAWVSVCMGIEKSVCVWVERERERGSKGREVV